MNLLLKSSVVALILSMSLQAQAHAEIDDATADYCEYYAEQISKGDRFIDYPNAGLVATFAGYVVKGGIVSGIFATAALFAHRYGAIPVLFASASASVLGYEVTKHFSMLDLSFKRRAKCAALGRIPAYHNVKKETAQVAADQASTEL